MVNRVRLFGMHSIHKIIKRILSKRFQNPVDICWKLAYSLSSLRRQDKSTFSEIKHSFWKVHESSKIIGTLKHFPNFNFFENSRKYSHGSLTGRGKTQAVTTMEKNVFTKEWHWKQVKHTQSLFLFIELSSVVYGKAVEKKLCILSGAATNKNILMNTVVV